MNCEKHNTEMIMMGSRHVCLDCLSEATEGQRKDHHAFELKIKQNEIDRKVKSSNIPAIYLNKSLETLVIPKNKDGQNIETAEKIYAGMTRYANNFEQTRKARTGFLFIGSQGTGKTQLACSVALRTIEKGFEAKYISLPSLTLSIRASYKDNHTTTLDIIESLIHADLLIIDEIDLHGGSEADYQVLYEIINARYIAGNKPVIALSNMTAEYLRSNLNERLIGRLLGDFPEINFKWPGFRTGKGAI